MRIQFKKAGFRELRTSAAADAILDREADAMSGRANGVPSTTDPAATEPYYKVFDASDDDRARRRIATTSTRAAKHEGKTDALQKAL